MESEARLEGEEVRAVLQLSSLTWQQFGDYSCRANNSEGGAERSVRVGGWGRVTGAAFSPGPGPATCVTATLQLEPEPAIQRLELVFLPPGWQVEVAVRAGSREVRHTQCQLSPGTEYSVTVTAVNSFGPAPAASYNFSSRPARAAWASAGRDYRPILVLTLLAALAATL